VKLEAFLAKHGSSRILDPALQIEKR